MTSSHSPSPQDFKFPPVRVDGSLTTLDLDTLMMRSIQSRQPEEAGSSLDDSSYDLLGDGVMDMSDDEAHTASIASTDGPTPDDTSDDFTDDEAEYETGDKDLHDSMHSSRAEIPEQHVDVHARAAWDDSTLTEVPSYLSGSESSWCITLEERPTDKEHVVQGRNVIQSSTDYTDHLPQVFSRYECGEVRLSVKAALSKYPLPTPDAYKILYIGMPEKWAEDITTAQIGTALGAYPSMSKSVMVRGQIEPYVPVPQVYRCTKLDILASHGTPTYILVTLEDGKQLKLGHDSPARSSERPDLVVICHRTQPDPTTEGQDIASSRKILSSAHIPCIELAQVIPHGTASLKNDVTALQVHVEGRNSPDTDYELKAILPLNHRGFSRLEPSQLNRHLALISPHLMKTEHMRQNQKARTSWIGEQVKMFKKKTGAQWPLTRMLISTLVLCALIPALFQGAAFAPMLYQKASQSMSALSLLSETENTIPNITPIAPLSSQVFSSVSSSSATPAMQGLTVIPAPPKQPDQKPKAKNEGVGGFEVHTTGSHQFVLCPSKAFTSNRKKPQLQIQVSRQSQAIPVRYNRTMTGEYIVELEQEYPFNRFDVSIATHTKPLLRQSFEVMLGHNKSTLDQFLDNAKSGLFNTQDALRNASTMAAQQMRLYMTVLNTDAMAASEQILRAQQEVQQQLEVNGRLAMQIPRATWMGLRDMTAPVRTSWAMKKARMNALRLRCKMEMATGLSAEGKEGKQSWACSKVQGEA